MPTATARNRARAALALTVCGCALALAGPARASSTIEVTSKLDSGSGTIRNALATAADGDTIVIPSSGDYDVSSAELTVSKNVTITGSGTDVRLVSDGDNRVFNVTASGSVTISNLTVFDGEVAGATAKGGGIANGSGSLTLQNVVLTNNSVVSPSGVASGAAVFNASGDLRISASTIRSNAAEVLGSGGAVSGGAVSNQSGHVTITQSIVMENSTGGAMGTPVSAGGISSDGGQLDVVDSTIESNEALGFGGPVGGGIHTHDTTVDISGSTLDGNSAVSTGGLGGEGGGVALFGGAGTLSDSTITNNSASGGPASEGGGLMVANGTFRATNVTIASNSAAGPDFLGGDLFLASTVAPTTFEPLNTIVSGASPNCAQQIGTTIASLGHNLDSGNECGFNGPGDQVDTDPQLGPLRGNGGPTLTLAPAPDSPAIDAGANSGCTAMDQRGVSRPQDGTCDIGAFERTFSTDLATSASGQPGSVPVGVPFRVMLDVSDSGPDPAADLTVSNLVPPRARLVSATPSQGSCGATSCTLGQLAPGAHATVALVLLPTRPGLLSNVFGVANRRPDATPAAAAISVRVTPLALTALSTSHRRFHFKLSAPARVTFVLSRRVKHHFVKAKKFSLSGEAGANTARLKGRLRTGSYRVTASARDAFGNRSAPRRLSLRLR